VRGSVSYDGYVDKNKTKQITELQNSKSKQINRKQTPDNPPPSAAGFTHSGDLFVCNHIEFSHVVAMTNYLLPFPLMQNTSLMGRIL
jgi:hypothetical protein